MNARVFLSINIIAIALVLLLLPSRITIKGEPLPSEQTQELEHNMQFIDVDKAARLINQSDTNFQFIDVRSKDEYLAFNLPGSINIPLEELLAPKWQGYLNQNSKTNIFYSNGDYYSNMASALLSAKGYPDNLSLKGGLNEWYNTVMNTEFTGGKLSARENALYGNRSQAKQLFIEINSLPDSLKNNFLEAKLLEEDALDGGCE